jgi:uncharacterized protein
MNTDRTEPRFWATGRFVRVRRRAGRVVLCLIFVEALLAAEFATYFGAPLLGIAAHLTILVGLVAASAMSGRGLRSLWLALTLAPLFRIVSIMIQMPEISRVYWYVIGSIPVLVGAFYVMRVLEYRPRDVGLTFASPVIQLLGVPLGIYLAVLGYTVLQTDTLATGISVPDALFPAMVLVATTGIVEELVFRGVIQRAARALGPFGFVFPAVIYAAMQVGRGSVTLVLFSLATGLIFGFSVKKTGSIAGASIAHGLMNALLYLVLPFVL